MITWFVVDWQSIEIAEQTNAVGDSVRVSVGYDVGDNVGYEVGIFVGDNVGKLVGV